jgi:nicotinate phosphoribosyltransferase
MENSTTPALHTDRYELTMLNAALGDGTSQRRAVFEVFARFLPERRRFGVVAGIERAIDAIQGFRFSPPQVSWLVEEGIVDQEHRDYLLGFRFSGKVLGYGEGELYLANSPILRVEGSFGEGVVLETILLSILNHDTAVASTAAQIFKAADGRRLIEMGSRRTHDEGAVHAARAAFIGGFNATSNLEAGYRYAIPTAGTAAHAWILSHDTEYGAFVAQIDALGTDTTLLVDTYDLTDGIVNAVNAAKSFGALGPGAVRIDSGDLQEQSLSGRHLLDSLGAVDTKIVATGDLDEVRIAALIAGGAPIDIFGVGTRLVAGANCPSPGFVYKLVAIEFKSGQIGPVAKRSPDKEDVGGVTYARHVSAKEAEALGGSFDEESVTVEVLFKEDPARWEHVSWSNPQRLLLDSGQSRPHPFSLEETRASTIDRLTSTTRLVQMRYSSGS